MADKFTEIEEAIWSALVANTEWKALIPAANRIKLTKATDYDPYRDNIQDSDLPEVVIEPAGGQANLFATSDAHQIGQAFNVVITTGQIRTSKALNPIKTATITALAAMSDTLGLSYVTKARFTGFTETPDDAARNRGLQGWVVIFTIEVIMYWTK